MEQTLTEEFIKQAIFRLYSESIPRLKICLDNVTEEQLWYRANENSNSLGNLVIHLTGNVNQWINTCLGGDPDNRDRQSEFDRRGGMQKEEMLNQLDIAMDRAREVLKGIEADDLVTSHHVQGFEETGMSIIMHVVEHFSYHVGQMTYIVKSINDIDIGYYSGKDLNVTTEK